MQITSVLPTELFVATPDGDAQVLAVTLADADAGGTVTASADGRTIGTAEARTGAVEVPMTGLVGRTIGERVTVQVAAGEHDATVELTVAEPGWTVWMIPHFHYDPVWWNTQAAYTATWDDLDGQAQQFRMAFQQTGFALVDAHLDVARLDPDYKFVLAEVDYLKPYWDARPQSRAFLRTLLVEGRLEIMGGTYNEPNTNLTTAETTARNFVYGAGFQREVLGGDPHTAWQLDAFGHDPQFPGLAAEAGLTSSSWARGPHHQWGPMLSRPDPGAAWRDPSVMQFPAEFEWISPSGRGVLTHYMPAHYSAGWQIDSRATLAEAEQAVYELFLLLKRVAATRNVLLPVGTDYTPPSKWVTEIHRDWNRRYAWPRFVCAIPRDFFAAVRSELDQRGHRAAPQTRDMNPVYTGKDVSFIDTKQAQRCAESLLVDAEMFATFAALRGASYPHAALDKAWRLLVYGAHHDAITGSESDQVYLDLLTGWREAYDIGRDVLHAATDHLAGQVDGAPPQDVTPLTVFNPSTWARTDLVTVHVTPDQPVTGEGLEVVAPDGRGVPSVLEHVQTDDRGAIVGADLTFVAAAPGVGHRAGWQVRAASGGAAARWRPEPGATSIESARYVIEVDPSRGGCVSRLFDKLADREVLRAGEVGNELLLGQEYSEHPEFHEGPWHLVPTGEVLHRSADRAAESVTVESSPLGRRLTVRGRLGAVDYTQQITLWDEVDRIDCRTSLDGFDGADQIVRVRWPADVPGALPVSDVGNAVVGRGFGFPDSDVAEHPWTLDNPAVNWFALSSTARIRVIAPEGGSGVARAVGIAEIVAADRVAAAALRDLAVAFAGQGVTATTSVGGGSRYGKLEVDSNLPDVRVAVGAPDENPFTAAVLADADEQYRIELDKQSATSGTARVWVPAARALRDVWQPSADLTGTRDLPVLIVVGSDEIDALVADLDDAVIDVVQTADAETAGEDALDDYTVAVLNTGMPSFSVDTTGALTMSILRSCTGWPSGVWINPPRRTALDGSNFQQQHWTHHYDYGLIAGAGDWRTTGLVRAGHELNHRLHTSQARARGAGLPAELRYVGVEGASDVLLAAVKAHGNPLAEGRAPEAIDAVTLRLVEGRGASGGCTVSTLFPIADAEPIDLLERPTGNTVRATARGVDLDLTPMQIRTLRLRTTAAAGKADLASHVEPHQPMYARYWLNNTGPAPRGNLPVTVHVEPTLIEWQPGGDDIELTVRVASDRTDAAANVTFDLVLPDDWHAESTPTPTAIDPDGFSEHTVRVTPPATAGDGCRWVRARLTGDDGYVVEDVARILVGTVHEPELTVAVAGPRQLAPGDTDAVEVMLTNDARTDISAQVQLISPWHTWNLLPQWNTGTAVTAGATTTLRLPVEVPLTADDGSWWVVVKVAAAGLLHYSDPLELRVGRR